VVNSENRLAGIVHIDEVAAAADRGVRDLHKLIGPPVTTSPSTTIYDLLPLATDTADPIAVTDDKNELLGLVVRVSILSAILGERKDDGEPEDR
jgi:glycine betaine/proline transport system ATP-binding protein